MKTLKSSSLVCIVFRRFTFILLCLASMQASAQYEHYVYPWSMPGNPVPGSISVGMAGYPQFAYRHAPPSTPWGLRTLLFSVGGGNTAWTHVDFNIPTDPMGLLMTPGNINPGFLPSYDSSVPPAIEMISPQIGLRVKNTEGSVFPGDCSLDGILYANSNCTVVASSVPTGTYTVLARTFAVGGGPPVPTMNELYVGNGFPTFGAPGTRGTPAGGIGTYRLIGTGSGIPYSVGFAVDVLGANPTMIVMPAIPAGTPTAGVLASVVADITAAFPALVVTATPATGPGTFTILYPPGPPGIYYRFWVGDGSGVATCEVVSPYFLAGTPGPIAEPPCTFNPTIMALGDPAETLCNAGGPPANDLCSGAFPFPKNGVVMGCLDNCTSTDAVSDSNCNSAFGRGLWYTYEGDGELLHLSTCGSAADTQIDVFISDDGTCDGEKTCATDAGISPESYQSESEDMPPFVECAGDDDISLKFRTIPDTKYFIYVGTPAEEGGGIFTLYAHHETAIYGCTNPLACNYDDQATWDDGSCEAAMGCTSPCATNYDPIANCDDGSCDFDGSPCNGCMDDSACNYDEGATLDPDDVCVFAGCIDSLACNYDPTASCASNSCDYSCYGCTDSAACNYDASTIDDGSCDYSCYGCPDPDACNYDPNSTIDSGECCTGNCIELQMFDSQGDGWNGGTYTVKDLTGNIIASGDLDSADEMHVLAYGIDYLCLQDDCYSIEIGGGDFPDEVRVQVLNTNQGTIVIDGEGMAEFTVGAALCVPGCTDSEACNYDPAANTDNNSCYYHNCLELDMFDDYGDGWNGAIYAIFSADDEELWASGSLNHAATGNTYSNGQDPLYLEDGCYYILVAGGDSDDQISWEINGANHSVSGGAEHVGMYFSIGDVSCTTCKNPTACNYDTAELPHEESLCEFTSCIGCTYADADNYESTATIDDGSCEFSPVDLCPFDSNGDNMIDTQDLLAFLGVFGTPCQ